MKAPQWMTLWAEHALTLIAEENEIEKAWEGLELHVSDPTHLNTHARGAIDEFLFYAELSRRRLNISTSGLTWLSWSSAFVGTEALEVGVDFLSASNGHPMAWISARGAAAAAVHARHAGRFFARKFVGHSLPAILLALLPYAGHPTEHPPPLPRYNPASRTGCSSDVMTAHVLPYGESCDSRMHPCDQYAFMIDNPPTAYVM
ncbi:MAG: hypothetical protein SGPRY_012852, partial [Prymnesium sp.]